MSTRVVPGSDLFILAGERSGDAYGAAILRALHARWPDLDCAAMGGFELRQAGADIEVDADGAGIVGFLPVVKHLPELVARGRHLAGLIRERRPKVVLSIDNPGFNLRLLRNLADMRGPDCRFLHVVAPQVWAWKPRRKKKIAKTVDRLLCYFPFEPRLFRRYFRRYGGQADFVGHPKVDLVPERPDTSALRQELGLGPQDKVLLLAPGSRRKEVEHLVSVMDAAWQLARDRLTLPAGARLHAFVSRTPDLSMDLYRQSTDLPLVDERYHELCALSHMALIASGTATLEAALLGLPHIICYRSDAASMRVARHLMITEHIGLPNIVHGQRVCPELLQQELTPARLAARLVQYWHDPKHAACAGVLQTTREALGGGGAMRRIADIVATELGLVSA